jgi:tRNA A37 threonylcarbamoyladenosine biosynthesis protein TsaE
LDRQDEIADLGLDELRDGAVLAVEWAERLTNAPADAWRVAIRALDDETREIRLAGPLACRGLKADG